ncbi:hypothetical protein HID58_040149 [Brassica napus]|uniref:Uncharacterized protein n=1 Tax=Brassica napus TaxID=3708 RepID=A0ABQ8B765_BRANA|nr:hypothetical protein HID58_040149 [Brassica napus]
MDNDFVVMSFASYASIRSSREVELFCCSNFKRTWKEPYGLVDICSTIRREGLEFGNMENERYNGSVQKYGKNS